ncbi:MAG: alpha/beta hydrolase [Caldilineaceae bacterium]|nr:alpha/beta hydrolase [Caldilineaceae bacterium]
MPVIETPRLRFHYREQGDGDGLPLLLVHGSFGSSRWWKPLLAVLPPEIHAIALDLRGCGQSDKPAAGYSIEEQATDLAAFVDAIGWDDFDLVGHASGAAIAIEFTLNRPNVVHTLALVDPAPIEGVFTPLEVILVLEQLKTDADLLRQALASLMPTYLGDAPSQAAFFAALVADAQQMAPAAFTAVAESLNQWNRFSEAKALTLPTLLIWGDQDHLVSRDAMTRSLIAIPGANNLEVLRNVGHSPMIEAPVALAERLIDFITEDYAEFAEVRDLAEEQASKLGETPI